MAVGFTAGTPQRSDTFNGLVEISSKDVSDGLHAQVADEQQECAAKKRVRKKRRVIRYDKQQNHLNDWGSNWSARRQGFRKATTPVVHVSSEVQNASHLSLELAQTTGQNPRKRGEI